MTKKTDSVDGSCLRHGISSDDRRCSDEQLVIELMQGRQQALVAIYNRYWDKLFVVAANLLNNAEEAEECVQNVFVGLWKRREKLQLTHTLNTYLSVSVKYQSLSTMARNQRRRDQFCDGEWTDPVNSASPENELLVKELEKRIEQSISRLPAKCQLIFRMSREQDMSVKMIASELELSENTIKMQLKIANRKLRQDLLTVLPLIFTLLGDKAL